MSDSETLFGDEHVRRYRETGGEVGHDWRRGSKILLLTTSGRTTGEPRTAPLIYENDGDRYIVVASKGGAPNHPGWYLNLRKTPEVELQVKDEVFPARARTATGEERQRLWELVAKQWPDYDEYAKKTDREIPVVVLAVSPCCSRPFGETLALASGLRSPRWRVRACVRSAVKTKTTMSATGITIQTTSSTVM
jgi:deazaflavin-dependent oxidoreductase (nitroreductase family)